LELTVDIHLQLRNALLPLRNMVRVGECLREAEEAARHLDDRRRRAWVSLYVQEHQWVTDESCDARTFAEKAEAAGEASDDAVLKMTSALYAGFGWFSAGDYRQAVRCQSDVLASLTCDTVRRAHAYHPVPLPAAHAHLTNALAELGEFATGIEHGRQA